jgi:ubiquitin C-terminal hydrolase
MIEFYDKYSKKVLEWSDYKLQTYEWISLAFPDTLSLTENEKYLIYKDKNLRKSIADITLKLIQFLKPIHKVENGERVGLFSHEFYGDISRVFRFLNYVEMPDLSAVLFLEMCQALKIDSNMRKYVSEKGLLKEWLETQSYISKEQIKKVLLKKEYKKEESEISNCPSFKGLEYAGNTCYMDSVFVALFGSNSTFVKKNIIDKVDDRTVFGKEVLGIVDFIRGKGKSKQSFTSSKTCTNFKKTLTGSDFSSSRTQDAGEFLLYFFNKFKNIENTIIQKTTYLGNDNSEELIKSSFLEIKSNPLLSISAQSYVNGSAMSGNESHQLYLEDFLTQKEDAHLSEDNLYNFKGSLYSRRIEITKVVKSDYLVFGIQRLYINERGSQKRDTTPIEFKKSIKIGENKLRLSAIVVHSNNHYTAYIKCEETGNWFYYDDTEDSIVFVGSFENMKEDSKNILDPKVYGTLYFYS